MLSAFARAFKTPDLRKKLLFTLGIMVLFRMGAHIPVPGVNFKAVNECVKQSNSGLFGLVNLFSGGALLQLTIFALGIMPYITASIILQLLTVVIPRLEALKKGGPGRYGEDHPVHPLPDHRAGDPAGHRHRGDRLQRRALLQLRGRQPGRPGHLGLPDRHHGHHDDRRYHGDHVAR